MLRLTKTVYYWGLALASQHINVVFHLQQAVMATKSGVLLLHPVSLPLM